MLKANSKKILDVLASQRTRNATEAYLAVHPTAGRATANVNMSNLLKKPEAQIYLETHVDRAKETVVELLDSKKDDIRLRSATEILDRNLGKSTQRVEQHTTGVTLSIDLTSALGDTLDVTAT